MEGTLYPPYLLFNNLSIMLRNTVAIICTLFLVLNLKVNAQADVWYTNAQSRIDTLRKGDFVLNILDINGNPISDSVKINLKEHDFPWGYAIDLSTGNTNSNSYSGSTSSRITTKYGDETVYRSERWGKYLAYQLPVVQGKTYNLTFKFAELYFSTSDSRIFDVYIDGTRVLKDFDKHAMANGKYIAFDTTFTFTAASSKAKIEFLATKDNVSINALALLEKNGTSAFRLNCGGSITTINGRTYLADASYINNSSASLIPTADDWNKAVMLKYCNYGVCGNQFKWSGIEPNKGIINYAPFDNTLSWFNKVGWDMRAHTLLWGGNNSEDYHCVPKWVMDLSSNPKVMYDTCRMRVMREVKRYKGKVKEYDVINEPIHANYLQKIVGDSLNWNCFKWAREADPDARLFVNDYNIIEWQEQTNTFVEFVKKLLRNGAPIDGIGAQCHIGSKVDIANFKARFDQLAQFGLPIKVTEFDMGAKSLTEQQYAVEMGKMLRLAFSHPAIEGFVFWGLLEPTWVPESIINIIREDKTTKIAADTVYNLIHKVWSTSVASKSGLNGKISVIAYYGDYEVLVKTNGRWEKHNVSLKKINKGSVINITAGAGVTPSPQVLGVNIVEPNQMHVRFDKKMTTPGNNLTNFKIFDSKLNYLISAGLKDGDSTVLVLNTNAPVREKDYIPLSYAPGTYRSADGGLLEYFGPVIDEKIKPSFLSTQTTADGKQIQVYFDTKISKTSLKAEEFIVSVNNDSNRVSSVSINANNDCVILTMSKQITSSLANITVTYSSGSLRRIDSLYVTSFDRIKVVNKVQEPKFVSANTSVTGNVIYVIFDQIMSEPLSEEPNFTLTSSLGREIIVAKAQLYTADKRRLSLTLSTPVYKGETISLNYNKGGLISTAGIPVATFTTNVTNVSITGLERVSDVEVKHFPSPFTTELTLENTSGYEMVSLVDVSGKICLQQRIDKRSSLILNTASLESGLYLLILSNEKEYHTSKVIKK